MNTRTTVSRGLGVVATVVLGALPATAGDAVASPAPSASVGDGTLTIVGTNGADVVALRLAAGDPTTLDVDLGADGVIEHHVERATFTKVVVELLGGDDRFTVDQLNGAFADEAITVAAGGGDDTIVGGDGDELTFGGSGDDDVDGNRGHDTAALGAGTDSFRWDPGDGSDDVDGGAGDDALVFFGANVAEEMRLSSSGRRAVFLRSPGNITMNLDGVERLDVLALGGADAVTIGDTTGTDLASATVDLTAGTGDLVSDVVTVDGSPKADRVSVTAKRDRVDVDGVPVDTRIVGSEPIDVLRVDGGDGNDAVDVADGVAASIGVVIDLGAGQR